MQPGGPAPSVRALRHLSHLHARTLAQWAGGRAQAQPHLGPAQDACTCPAAVSVLTVTWLLGRGLLSRDGGRPGTAPGREPTCSPAHTLRPRVRVGGTVAFGPRAAVQLRTGRGGNKDTSEWKGGGPSPRAPPPAPWAGAVAGDSGPGGSRHRRLPCSSCARQRPLRQRHTAARVTTWPTTTREGNRLPEGSMALGLRGRRRSTQGRPSEPRCERRRPLPSLPCVQRADEGPAPPAAPPCRTESCPAPTVLPPPPGPPPSSLRVTCTPHPPPRRRRPSSAVPAQLSRSRLAGTLTPAYPQPHPPRGGACATWPAAAPPAQPGRRSPTPPPPGRCTVPKHPILPPRVPSGDSCQARGVCVGGRGVHANAPALTGPPG